MKRGLYRPRDGHASYSEADHRALCHGKAAVDVDDSGNLRIDPATTDKFRIRSSYLKGGTASRETRVDDRQLGPFEGVDGMTRSVNCDVDQRHFCRISPNRRGFSVEIVNKQISQRQMQMRRDKDESLEVRGG